MISHWNSYKTALFNEYYVEQDSLVIPGHFSTKGLVNFPKALLERANATRPLPGELRPSLRSGPAAKAASVLCWDTPPRAAWLPLAVSSGSHWWCCLPFPVTILPILQGLDLAGLKLSLKALLLSAADLASTEQEVLRSNVMVTVVKVSNRDACGVHYLSLGNLVLSN